ncbi:MAG TPA: protein kinase, partial [Polyangiaceae bacterium]|nr:protein kinase [Polyangiaceae bacterium]
REGEALERLNHPNIVRVLAQVRELDRDYLVMEYIPGGSLETLLRHGEEPLPLGRVLAIALDLCDALTRTHRLDIIHRDLKPSNVLLAEDGSPRLTDFGVAFMEGQERLTESASMVGTPDYLSPEALQGEELDARADLWAFGVLLFEMLTGKRPFGHRNIAQTFHNIAFAPPPAIGTLRPDCPPALADLIYRLLAKNRGDRVPSARQVGAELDRILHGWPSPALVPRSTPLATAGLATTEARPALRHNLPHETATFVGRKPELAELERFFDQAQTRLVTVLAPGGMGKTRLALELCQRWLSAAAVIGPEARSDAVTRRQQVEHGIFFVELAPLAHANFVVSAISEAVGYPFYAGAEPKQQLIEHLRTKRMLLLLDNFEHVLDAAGLVHDILRSCEGIRILVTSRQRLGLGIETLYPLAGMDFPEPAALDQASDFSAVRLFVQGARQVQPDFRLDSKEAEHVVQICSLVHGVPLGIVLSASWASVLSPSEIAGEIARNMDFLAAELKDLPERQRSIRAVFDHSWRLLEAPGRDALAALSVFRGGFTRDAARVVAQAGLPALAGLIDRSLLRRDAAQGRYHVHELLREYAGQMLAKDPAREEQVETAHARYFARFLAERETRLKGPQPVLAAQEIELELDNVRAAYAYWVSAGNFEELEPMLEPMLLFHSRRASFAEAESAYGELIERVKSIGAPNARLLARALALRALFLRQQGRYAQAEALLVEALAQLESESVDRTSRERALALVILGSTKAKTGSVQEGAELAERGLALYRETRDTWGLAQALETLGRLHSTAGDFEKAERVYSEGSRIQRASGMLPSALMGLGIATSQQGNYQAGCTLMLEALAMFEKAGDTWNKMRCQMNLANAKRNIGAYAEAESLARDCLNFSCEVSNWDHEAWSLFQLGNILKEQNRYAEAAEYFERARERSLQAGDAGKIALAELEFGDLALIRGELELATRHLTASLEGFESAGQTWGVALALDQLAYAACQAGDHRRARDFFARALETALTRKLLPFALNSAAGLARLLARSGQDARALELLTMVELHPAVERHTLTRRVAPLRSELEARLPDRTLTEARQNGSRCSLAEIAAFLEQVA